VDSGKYGVNAGVVVEYITAMVASRQLEQYARASAADPATAAAAAAGGAGGAQGSEGAALAALLGRLQLAAAGGEAGTGAGEGGGRLGASRSRPLHVVLQVRGRSCGVGFLSLWWGLLLCHACSVEQLTSLAGCVGGVLHACRRSSMPLGFAVCSSMLFTFCASW
jgi:hypothetical protein